MFKFMFFFKIVFFTTLLMLFVVMFGKPSFERFAREDVTTSVFTERVEEGNQLPFPAITVCPANSQTMTGWKDSTTDAQEAASRHNFLEEECATASVSDTYECMDNRTYTQKEAIQGSSVFNLGSDSHDLSDAWTKEFTTTYIGNCFSLSSNSSENEYIQVVLNPTLKYYLLLHDNDFFVLNNNPLALSKVMFILEGGISKCKRRLNVLKVQKDFK